MRKAINTWHMSAGKVGHEHSWGVFSTAEVYAALAGWGVSEDDSARIMESVEKAAPACGKGILRHSALVAYAESGDPVTIKRHA